MILFTTGVLKMLALATPWFADVPKKSATVVTAEFSRYTIADGLESCFVTLKVKHGWHVYANPAGAKEQAKADAKEGVKTDPAAGVTMEFWIDGMPASVHAIYYPPGVVKTDAAGNKYRAYDSDTSFTVWLFWEETEKAKVLTARVRVIATNGKTRLKESVLTAETR
jgi:hypothetical protein